MELGCSPGVFIVQNDVVSGGRELTWVCFFGCRYDELD